MSTCPVCGVRMSDHPEEGHATTLESILADQTPEEQQLQWYIDHGLWSLEGSVGRAMDRALEAGRCVLGVEPASTYWGQPIPSRFQVKPGTKGSIEYALKAREEDR